jgi:hypothetical protein
MSERELIEDSGLLDLLIKSENRKKRFKRIIEQDF